MNNHAIENFYGRGELLEQLYDLCGKSAASLVTCRGRRRVGKSTLIEEFAIRNGFRFIKIEGKRPDDKKMSVADELATFAKQLSQQTDSEKIPPADWPDAFLRLDAQIHDGERTVVLLDEISWLAYGADGFADDLKIAWDNRLKKHSKLILVLCGSVSSWITANVIDNRAYVGRRSLDLVVPELPVAECVKFWGKRASRVPLREIVDVLSVTGGVPRYLEEINPSLTAEENIRRLCFRPRAVLRTDFDEMFRDVITSEFDFTGRILRGLIDGPKSAAELTAELHLQKGGRISAALERLTEAGFVSEDLGRNPETGEQPREKRFRLRDNYTRFYLKYIEPIKDVIDMGSFDYSSFEEFVDFDVIMGLQFENLVINNFRQLVPFLHLQKSAIVSAAPYRRRGTSGPRGIKGCQIDLLVQTRRSLCIVEVKRQREIGREVIAEVQAKVGALKRPADMAVKTALVYDGHLSPIVEADGYFDAIIPFGKLMGV